ncbi:Fe-S cluster assembly protein SufD [Pseudomarimonas salicorniae]|uniref:Fe-S cluster assembly protein SufD n=1 Tax=Pseudomarimonas salicorniae TaxID=2933270 RepID=A0ABT0GDT7_9GAMM|nr:Fe-S cluster assembly protein SufD [Lysobacter sp. CAU 1642]MCK7592713.1 Fe-S cluster assembly protein SufD [Lysobacter sp. CAU 1642]
MPGLIDSFAAQHAALPEPLRSAASRGEALAALQRDGLPGPRSEPWKYTSLRALGQRAFFRAEGGAQLEAATVERIRSLPAPRLVLVDGRFDAGLSDLTGLPEGARLRPLSALLGEGDSRDLAVLAKRFAGDDALFPRANAALAEDGLWLQLAAGVEVSAPVHWVHVSTPRDSDVSWHLRSLVELREGARLSLCEYLICAGGHRHLGSSVLHVHLAQGAFLEQLALQQESAGSALFRRTEGAVAAGAEYRRLDLELGGGLSRHELNVSLQGAAARLQADGVLLGQDASHVDTRLGIDHAIGGTRSAMTWRGLGRDQSRVAFHGGIGIRAGADDSEAMLSNKNLLLSDEAEIDTQPVLEIHADEVKAAHGATVGRLDPTALFYLRTRGLPAAQARALLTRAFCLELLSELSDGLRDIAEAALQEALGD